MRRWCSVSAAGHYTQLLYPKPSKWSLKCREREVSRPPLVNWASTFHHLVFFRLWLLKLCSSSKRLVILTFCVSHLSAQWRLRCLHVRTADTIAKYRLWRMSVQVWGTALVGSVMDGLCFFVVVPTESGGSFAAPGGQQEPDPGVGPDANGRWRPGWAHPAQTGRLQHPMGRTDGPGKALVLGYVVFTWSPYSLVMIMSWLLPS